MSISEDSLIKFSATVERLSTTVDGAIRVTLDLDAGAIEQAAALLQARRINALLEVVILMVNKKSE